MFKSCNSTAQTFPDVAIEAAAWRGDHPAVVEGARDRVITYAELVRDMRRAAAGFVAAGLASGDRVAIWAHNGIDWIVACLGVHAAGGIVVPLNTRFKAMEAAYILERSRARFLVHSRSFLGSDYRAMVETLDLPELERLIAIPTKEAATNEWEEFLAAGAADAAAVAEAEMRLQALRPEDVSDIMFTSGTTGAPKGVVTNHGQNVRTYRAWVAATTLCADDRYAMIWPFFHCSGYKSGWLCSLIAGSTLYPQTQLDTPALVRLIAAEKISVLPGPPTLFQSLLASPEARSGHLQSLRVTVTGATMVAPSLIESIRDDLGMEAIFAGYGLTETCGTATMTSAEDRPEVVVTSPGKAIEGLEIAAMDSGGQVLAPGLEGEIVVRGHNVMLGYFEDPEATAEAIDAEGWLHSGDIGTVDERGYLVITGRKKDIYIVGGFNCYPAEIEDMMLRHPAVAEVAVIGMKDERLGEVGKAYVILDPAASPVSEPDLIAWCRDAMANFKVPRAIVFTADLPRTATGKVQKFRLQNGEFG